MLDYCKHGCLGMYRRALFGGGKVTKYRKEADSLES